MALLAVKPDDEQEISPLSQQALFLQKILDFLPIRLLAFIFALGGHFTKVFPYWSKHVLRGVSSNETLLIKAGLLAILGDEQNKIPEDGSAEKNAIGLLDRSTVILLVLIAVAGLII
jgi:membrane protein required for beta-lactamase induction